MRQRTRGLPVVIVCLLALQALVGAVTARSQSSPSSALADKRFASLPQITRQTLRVGKIAGAVVLIGDREKILYQEAFGDRALIPHRVPMTLDTIFDLASLTKVLATATAVMQLVERGSLQLDEPVSNLWPEFKAAGKEEITVLDLLTHSSGLRSGLDRRPNGLGVDGILRMIAEEKPVCSPKTKIIYSDINFLVLGELVRRVSGQPLDKYCYDNIFKPLGMKDTGFNPSPGLHARIAPTQFIDKRNGRMLRGEVHDPTASCMGGVAGHAGLFSTASDLFLFCRMLLGDGSLPGGSVLSRTSIRKMTTAQTPPGNSVPRGLGWEMASPSGTNGMEFLGAGSYGHTGFTGTSIWIDPASEITVIILTSRLHPDGKGSANPLRSLIAAELTSAGLLSRAADGPSLSGSFVDTNRHPVGDLVVKEIPNGAVQTGIDVLKAENFAPLVGLRIGLITNHTGIDSSGRRTLDLLHRAPQMKLAAIFSPEHGLSGEMDHSVPSSTEPSTHLAVYSLYGKDRRPTAKMLRGLDALVFDIQDAGARFYTYITTLGYTLEAAAKKGIPFYVLDRPNPITASSVQGPVLDKGMESFTGYFPLPIRHGMTVGELAQLFNAEKQIGARLRVIKMEGYQRTDWYEGTGLLWVKPSPNLRTLTQTVLYPGVALIEGANVSVGRGTETPFEIFGAPWIDGKAVAHLLNSRRVPGVQFEPLDFTPNADRFRNETCHGVRILLVDREALDSPALGIEMVAALHNLYPGEFLVDKTLGMIGSREVLDAIKGGQDPVAVVQGWQRRLEDFCRLRAKYLLY